MRPSVFLTSNGYDKPNDMSLQTDKIFKAAIMSDADLLAIVTPAPTTAQPHPKPRIYNTAIPVPDEDLDIVEAHYIDMYNTLAPNGYNKSVGFNDNSLAEELDDLTDDNDYSDNAKVMIDDVSDDDVDRFLREL